MEHVIEHDEVRELLLEALAARGIKLPTDAVMKIRRNNKKNTIRVVFTDNRSKPDKAR